MLGPVVTIHGDQRKCWVQQFEELPDCSPEGAPPSYNSSSGGGEFHFVSSPTLIIICPFNYSCASGREVGSRGGGGVCFTDD